MSDPISLFDPNDDEEERALEEAYAAIAEGRVVPHEEVVRWFLSLGKPDELPIPTAGPRCR